MTQEDKNLLLRDLCGRLPYGVKLQKSNEQNIIVDLYAINLNNYTIDFYTYKGKSLTIGNTSKLARSGILLYKPCLFPMSSLTEEQYNSLHELGILNNCSHSYEYVNPHIHGVSFIFKEFKTYSLELIEWLLKNHFDIYGLIPMNLAIDATNLNIY